MHNKNKITLYIALFKFIVPYHVSFTRRSSMAQDANVAVEGLLAHARRIADTVPDEQFIPSAVKMRSRYHVAGELDNGAKQLFTLYRIIAMAADEGKTLASIKKTVLPDDLSDIEVKQELLYDACIAAAREQFPEIPPNTLVSICEPFTVAWLHQNEIQFVDLLQDELSAGSYSVLCVGMFPAADEDANDSTEES